jgi:signal-transduction protein with cAMP-binding, CBS, and nucleotidyltransferase domain
MTRRAAELAEERPRIAGASPPPVAYAVLVLDSAGRKESQLAADQDNAIVYAKRRTGGRLLRKTRHPDVRHPRRRAFRTALAA